MDNTGVNFWTQTSILRKFWGKIRLMFQNNLTDSFQTSIFLNTGTIDTTKKKMLKQIKDSLFLVGI